MAFGKINSSPLFLSLVIALGGIAALTDFRTGKIYNWLTFPFIVGGLLYQTYLSGLTGMTDALAGCLLGLGLGFIPFWMNWLGAGDVKLMMALGSLGGGRFIQEVLILSLFLGSFMGLIQLTWRGKLVGFLKRLQSFLRSRLISGLEPEEIRLDRTTTLPFAIPLGIGAIWTAWSHPVLQGGWLLW